jgi:hypothetical protein
MFKAVSPLRGMRVESVVRADIAQLRRHERRRLFRKAGLSFLLSHFFFGHRDSGPI